MVSLWDCGVIALCELGWFPPPPPTDKLPPSLVKSMEQTLAQYQSTLKSQGMHISELESEGQTLHTLNQDLVEKLQELELKHRKATSSKETLDLKVLQLTEKLEGVVWCCAWLAS